MRELDSRKQSGHLFALLLCWLDCVRRRRVARFDVSRYWCKSRHGRMGSKTSLLTHCDTSPPSNAALRKVHSPLMLAHRASFDAGGAGERAAEFGDPAAGNALWMNKNEDEQGSPSFSSSPQKG
jgi:hypothetical protein